MAIVVKALILCATTNPDEALGAVFSALNSGAFETANPILDFATGLEQVVALGEDYVDGSFVHQVPGAQLLTTANATSMPC